MNKKRVIVGGIIVAILLVILGSCYGSSANAVSSDVPEECVVYVQDTEDYLLAVIGNYQDALDVETENVAYWRTAEERVAAAAVRTNYLYAAEVEKNRKLTDKVRYLRSIIRDLRGN